MYTLYTDRQETFKCNIGIEGAELENTKARLVIESKNHSLLFEGEIDSQGHCEVEISKLKRLIGETTTGNIRLEVIADDTFFTPWEDTYEVETSKKVTVEVMNTNKEVVKESKSKLSVKVEEQAKSVSKPKKKKKTHGMIVAEVLKATGVSNKIILENPGILSSAVDKYVNGLKVKDKEFMKKSIFKEIINYL
jgi:hypothetical protein